MKYSIVENILQGLNRSTEIVSSAVVSTDGLPIATALQIGVDEDRIGAMSAAMLSLGTRSAKEVLQGSLKRVGGYGALEHVLQCPDECHELRVVFGDADVGCVAVLQQLGIKTRE